MASPAQSSLPPWAAGASPSPERALGPDWTAAKQEEVLRRLEELEERLSSGPWRPTPARFTGDAASLLALRSVLCATTLPWAFGGIMVYTSGSRPADEEADFTLALVWLLGDSYLPVSFTALVANFMLGALGRAQGVKHAANGVESLHYFLVLVLYFIPNLLVRFEARTTVHFLAYLATLPMLWTMRARISAESPTAAARGVESVVRVMLICLSINFGIFCIAVWISAGTSPEDRQEVLNALPKLDCLFLLGLQVTHAEVLYFYWGICHEHFGLRATLFALSAREVNSVIAACLGQMVTWTLFSSIAGGGVPYSEGASPTADLVVLDALKGVRKFSQPGWYGYTQFIALGLLLLSVYLAGDFPDKYDDSDEEYEMPISTPGTPGMTSLSMSLRARVKKEEEERLRARDEQSDSGASSDEGGPGGMRRSWRVRDDQNLIAGGRRRSRGSLADSQQSSPARGVTESRNGNGGIPYYTIADTEEDFPEPSSPMTPDAVLPDDADDSDRPPAPDVPSPWKAVWNDEEKNYYYWNPDTDETSWDPPQPA